MVCLSPQSQCFQEGIFARLASQKPFQQNHRILTAPAGKDVPPEFRPEYGINPFFQKRGKGVLCIDLGPKIAVIPRRIPDQMAEGCLGRGPGNDSKPGDALVKRRIQGGVPCCGTNPSLRVMSYVA